MKQQEDKDLLLQVLCTMLPYKPIVHVDDGLSLGGKGSDYTLLGINANKRIALLGLEFDDAYATHKEYLDNIKPYLRPMSDMTEEEIEIFNSDFGGTDDSYNSIETKRIDWLNKNKFDYRYLIPKGLALKAKDGMYK